MEFSWSPEEEALRQGVRELVNAEVPADWLANPRGHYVENEADRQRAVEFAGKLRDHNWLTPHWPSEYGGADMPAWQHVILGEELWAVGEPRGPQYMSVNWIGPAILRYGTEEQKQLHVRKIADGNAFWCQGFSEPNAGSDLASLRTSAVREGDEYVVNGQKIWTSHTPSADYCFLLVRTDPAAKKGQGITILLVPMDTPGIEVRLIPNLAETVAFAEVFLTDVRVPVANRLGPENGGWQVVREALQNERVGSPRWARAALVLDHVAELAKKNAAIEDPVVAQHLACALAACEAARWVAYSVIDERAKGKQPSAQAYVARAAMVRAERAVAEAAMQVLQGEGMVDESTVGENYFAGLTAGVAAGTYEVQLNLIASQVLKLPRG